MSALVAIALSSMIAAHDPKAEDPKAALDAFQGEWKLTTWAKLGRPFPKDKLENSKVVVKEGAFSMTLDEQTTDMTFALDPKAEPPALDFRSEGNKRLIRGIYKREKDKITICFGIENSPRPTEFKAGRDTSIMVLERAKK
jgi:uncharacterized protein (TIGR03067 family)